METFYETYPNIDLETASFSSNEEAVAKIQAGFEADVINSCVDEATLEMVNKGMYMPLDTSRLENWDDIWPGHEGAPRRAGRRRGVHRAGRRRHRGHHVQRRRDHDAARPRGRICSIPQYAGRASLEDLAITALDVGALANGIANPLEMTDEQLTQVTQYLKDHRDQFRTFWKGQADIRAQFKSGEVVISSGYPGDAKLMREGRARTCSSPRPRRARCCGPAGTASAPTSPTRTSTPRTRCSTGTPRSRRRSTRPPTSTT